MKENPPKKPVSKLPEWQKITGFFINLFIIGLLIWVAIMLINPAIQVGGAIWSMVKMFLRL